MQIVANTLHNMRDIAKEVNETPRCCRVLYLKNIAKSKEVRWFWAEFKIQSYFVQNKLRKNILPYTLLLTLLASPEIPSIRQAALLLVDPSQTMAATSHPASSSFRTHCSIILTRIFPGAAPRVPKLAIGCVCKLKRQRISVLGIVSNVTRNRFNYINDIT